MDSTQLIRQTELLGAVDAETLAHLAANAKPLVLKRNQVLFEEGDEAGDLYIVDSGRISIYRQAPDGRETTVAFMEDGDLFGEQSLFDGIGRSAGARALESSELISISFSLIKDLFAQRPDLLWGVVKMMSIRLRETNVALADSVFLDVSGRTAKRLLELSEGDNEFSLPITQEELSNLVGASRERVNKALAMFSKLGWLEQIDRRYKILNRDALTLRSR